MAAALLEHMVAMKKFMTSLRGASSCDHARAQQLQILLKRIRGMSLKLEDAADVNAQLMDMSWSQADVDILTTAVAQATSHQHAGLDAAPAARRRLSCE